MTTGEISARCFPVSIRRAPCAVDWSASAFVNLLQARHPLPADFRARWDRFTAEWAGRPVEDFYRIPPDFAARIARARGRLHFASPWPGEHRRQQPGGVRFFPLQAGLDAPTMLLAHGLMSVSDIGYRLWARRLNARGWNAVFVHLPYHYSRRLPWHFHGELCVGGDLLRTARACGNRWSNAASCSSNCAGRAAVFSAVGDQLWRLDHGAARLFRAAAPTADFGRADPQHRQRHLALAEFRVVARRRCAARGSGPKTRPGACAWFARPKAKGAPRSGQHILMLAGQYDQIAPPEEIEELGALVGRNAHSPVFRRAMSATRSCRKVSGWRRNSGLPISPAGPSFTAPVSELKEWCERNERNTGDLQLT
jgi:hypothetical protein